MLSTIYRDVDQVEAAPLTGCTSHAAGDNPIGVRDPRQILRIDDSRMKLGLAVHHFPDEGNAFSPFLRAPAV